ncbi:uncharacterized protein LOC123989122 [Osmia bicornis bicornis]|uniref:uncharacterized protein LOC123989122 n=1 Tax=Osmia bicornis bicornis TaxID=1437191 RepID=UPI001EAEEA61|nr:uncharacterized protein LOC123989122 [Osmia bicornis bicornis]XP_046145758.1 uncharacterized protein LOC123989122 [Osmia bicornis bicornis]XP_046145759.1 uncharacterized protein LOC123989122 [Osmia bicornis bicornis]XP_046145760.1 uncharacterized protein LOC123989122 [Osmia bicornis bicornis]
MFHHLTSEIPSLVSMDYPVDTQSAKKLLSKCMSDCFRVDGSQRNCYRGHDPFGNPSANLSTLPSFLTKAFHNINPRTMQACIHARWANKWPVGLKTFSRAAPACTSGVDFTVGPAYPLAATSFSHSPETTLRSEDNHTVNHTVTGITPLRWHKLHRDHTGTQIG